jgi:hypothetical protein
VDTGAGHRWGCMSKKSVQGGVTVEEGEGEGGQGGGRGGTVETGPRWLARASRVPPSLKVALRSRAGVRARAWRVSPPAWKDHVPRSTPMSSAPPPVCTRRCTSTTPRFAPRPTDTRSHPPPFPLPPLPAVAAAAARWASSRASLSRRRKAAHLEGKGEDSHRGPCLHPARMEELGSNALHEHLATCDA